jgi:hypothetical protein
MTPSGSGPGVGRCEQQSLGRVSLRLIRLLFWCASAIALAFAFLFVSSSAGAAPVWASASTATVHPGVQTFTDGAQCTANFIYADASNVYIGQAAHCAGTGGNTETNGCTSASLPLGTEVDVTGASHPGTIVYSSWLEMQAEHETDADTCQYNDLALVRLDPSDVGSTNPSVPFFGGPTGVGVAANLGDRVYSYGNSELRGGITQLSPKYGISLGNTDGWSTAVYTVTPGIPGDSGSGLMDAQGRAIGVLSTLELAPHPAGNNFGDLAHELAYLHTHTSFSGVQVVNGTQPFAVPLLPLG